jgi:hypothetical protein
MAYALVVAATRVGRCEIKGVEVFGLPCWEALPH